MNFLFGSAHIIDSFLKKKKKSFLYESRVKKMNKKFFKQLKTRQFKLFKSMNTNILELFSRRLLHIISKDKDDKLVGIYGFICEKNEELKVYCERLSNNNKP